MGPLVVPIGTPISYDDGSPNRITMSQQEALLRGSSASSSLDGANLHLIDVVCANFVGSGIVKWWPLHEVPVPLLEAGVTLEQWEFLSAGVHTLNQKAHRYGQMFIGFFLPSLSFLFLFGRDDDTSRVLFAIAWFLALMVLLHFAQNIVKQQSALYTSLAQEWNEKYSNETKVEIRAVMPGGSFWGFYQQQALALDDEEQQRKQIQETLHVLTDKIPHLVLLCIPREIKPLSEGEASTVLYNRDAMASLPPGVSPEMSLSQAFASFGRQLMSTMNGPSPDMSRSE